jgi:hypothetical protein
MILDVEFCTFVQGELSISEYCRHFKGIADALDDLGDVVLDLTIILTILHGLNDGFSHMASLLKRQWPFPSFAAIHNDLQLEEIKLMSKLGSSSMALVANMAVVGRTWPAASCASTPAHAPAPSAPPVSPKKNNNHNRNNNNKHDHNQNYCTTTNPMAANPWLRSLQLYGAAA